MKLTLVRRKNVVDWRSLVTGGLCLASLGFGVLLTGYSAVYHYGWAVGLLIGWLVGPIIGGAFALVVFLWLLPLQPPASLIAAERRAKRRPFNALPTSGPPVSITIVLPVYNGKSFLERSLPPLAEMLKKGEALELIVVDDGSTDGSAAFAAAYGATVVPSGGRLGPGAARNLAAQMAKGEVLWFVDADVVVYPDGPARVRRAFSEEGVVAVFGSYDNKPPEPNFGSQYKNLVHHHTHQKANEEASTFWSGCGAVSRAAFLEVGGFDPAKYHLPSIEDVELGYRLREAGGKVKIDRHFLSVHLKRWSVPELIRTDILRRAVPWCRLMMERNELINDLNVAGSERLRAGLAAVIVMAIAGSIIALSPVWILPFLCLTAVTTNWPLFRVFYRSRGVPFALLAIAFHQIYYIYSSCVFVFCWAEAKLTQVAKAPGPKRIRPNLAPPAARQLHRVVRRTIAVLK